MPTHGEVFRMLRDFGERGLLEQFAAVVVGKPKAWSRDQRNDAATRHQYREQQRDAVLRVLDTYNPEALVVIGPDFGHTDPQYIVPYGGLMTIDGPSRRISMTY